MGHDDLLLQLARCPLGGQKEDQPEKYLLRWDHPFPRTGSDLNRMPGNIGMALSLVNARGQIVSIDAAVRHLALARIQRQGRPTPTRYGEL